MDTDIQDMKKTSKTVRPIDPQLLKEEALRNAPLISEEELAQLRRPKEEVIEEALAEFNRLCDEIDRELESDGKAGSY